MTLEEEKKPSSLHFMDNFEPRINTSWQRKLNIKSSRGQLSTINQFLRKKGNIVILYLATTPFFFLIFREQL